MRQLSYKVTTRSIRMNRRLGVCTLYYYINLYSNIYIFLVIRMLLIQRMPGDLLLVIYTNKGFSNW